MDTERISAVGHGAHASADGGRRTLFVALSMLVVLLVVSGAAARADEMHLLINGKAIHFDKRSNVRYNEDNWGAGFQYEWSETPEGWVPFVTAAWFDDSNENPSYYAGGGALRRFHFGGRADGWHADLGLVAFLMTRKGYKDGDPFPGVLPAFSFGTKTFSVNATYVPRVDPKTVPLVFFQLKLRLAEF
ncbi:MAG TPA: hypothetical protein VIL43_00250 [Burkholderiales bacterium]